MISEDSLKWMMINQLLLMVSSRKLLIWCVVYPFECFSFELCLSFMNSSWKLHNALMQENIPLEEVFENLKCTQEGLSSNAAKQRLDLFGYNKLEEKKVGN